MTFGRFGLSLGLLAGNNRNYKNKIMKFITVSALAIAGLALASYNTASSIGNAAGGAVKATGNAVSNVAESTVNTTQNVGGNLANDVKSAARIVTGN